MPEPPSQRRRRRLRRRDDCRELIHHLNQCYRREWARAEQLRGELERLRGWTLWPLVAWARRLKRWLRPPVADPPFLMRAARYEGPAGTKAPDSARVSIVIPFKDRLELLRNCLRSLRVSTWRNFEVVLVNNGSVERRTQRYLWRLETGRKVQLVDCPGPFNFSRLCNEGARRASGDHLLFLNNDTEVLTPDWLERLLEVAADPRVGVVGATLLYPDRTIQHAGIFPRADGHWIHACRGEPEDCEGDGGELRHARCVPAATAACFLLRREQFLALGGFDERLPVTFSDVDLCRRARERGLLVVVTPHARLWHFEGLTRGYAVDSAGAGHLSALGRLPAEKGEGHSG
jgi:GT2 family glycosyltransferase